MEKKTSRRRIGIHTFSLLVESGNLTRDILAGSARAGNERSP